MRPSNAVRKIIFLLMKITFAIATVYHASGLLYKIDGSSVARHGLFVFLDLFCLYGFFVRPRYFVFLFAVFTAQQYYKHGQQLIQMWANCHEIHWISLFVLILLPIGLMSLIADGLDSTVDGIFTNPEVQ